MEPPRKPLATKERLAAIAAMSDDEFVLFALDHVKQIGKCTVTTSEAWSEDLTTDHQQHIAQRFREAAERITEFNGDVFNNSMEQVIRDSDIVGLDRIHHHKQTKEFKGPVELSEEEKNWERWHHKKLLKEGGRPCYDIDDLDEVAKNPELKYHITSPWMHYEAALWKDKYADAKVFTKQHDHWARFRIWQRVNRNHDGLAYPTYRVGTSGDALGAPTLKWYKEKAFVEFQKYEKTVLSILKECGIPPPAALELRLKHQDELVTWKEYLCFIYLHLGWATQEMVDHRLNGEDFLENLRSSGHVHEGTTLKDVESMLFSAWVRTPVLPIDDVRRSLQQQKEVLLKRLKEAVDGEAKAAVEEEIRLLDENYEANEQRERDLAEKCWELTYSLYENDWPWCIAARKVFCYERLAVWARDQIPLVRAELKGRKDCKECKARDQATTATDQALVITDQIIVVIDQAPTVTEQTLTTTEQTPAPTDQTNVVTDQASADTEQSPAVSGQTPATTDQAGRAAQSNPLTAGGIQESQVSSAEDNPLAPHNPIIERTTRDQGVQVDISTESRAVENVLTVDSPTSAAPLPGPRSEDAPRSRKRKATAPVEAPRRSKRVATLKVKKEEEAAAAAREEDEHESQPPAKARKAKAAPKPKPKSRAAPKSKAKSKAKRK